MKYAMKTVAGLVAVGALLAAGPATNQRPETAWRKMTIQLPSSILHGDSDMDQESFVRFATALNPADSDMTTNLEDEAAAHLSVPPTKTGYMQTYWGISSREESLSSGRMTVRLSISPENRVNPGSSSPVWPTTDELNQWADAVVDAMRDRVIHQWDRIVSGWKEMLARGQQAAEDATARLSNLQAEIARTEATLRQMTGGIDLPPDKMQAVQEGLAQEKQKLELDLAGLKARQEALQQAVAQQAEKVQAAQSHDVVAEALQKAVAVAKERLQFVRAQYKQGLTGPAEVSQAELAELDAEAKLLERKNAAGGSADAMAQWNRTLADATIEQREKEARLAAATKMLASLADTAEQQTKLKGLKSEADMTQRRLDQANGQIRPAREWLDRYGMAKPVIEVKGNGPTTAPAK